MLNDLRAYLQLANGLSDVTKAKAKEIAMELVSQGIALSTKAPDIKGQVQELTDELLSTSRNNREMLIGLVTSEVDRAVSRMGFVREDELAAVRRHVQRLEKEIAEVKNSATKVASKSAAPKKNAAASGTSKVSTAKKAASKSAGVKKAVK
jgi:polyhydroxyalkanoate synthesis regulator phasin